MKRNLKIVGSIFGVIGSMLLLYNSISGVLNSAEHGTRNIFDTILLPFSILLLIFSVIILIGVLKNKPSKFINAICISTIIITFIIGLLFIWFAIVKSDNNIFYGITGSITFLSSILLLYKN